MGAPLVATNVLLAASLMGMGLAQDPVGLFAAWVLMGIAMGSGVYEAAFAGGIAWPKANKNLTMDATERATAVIKISNKRAFWAPSSCRLGASSQ